MTPQEKGQISLKLIELALRVSSKNIDANLTRGEIESLRLLAKSPGGWILDESIKYHTDKIYDNIVLRCGLLVRRGVKRDILKECFLQKVEVEVFESRGLLKSFYNFRLYGTKFSVSRIKLFVENTINPIASVSEIPIVE